MIMGLRNWLILVLLPAGVGGMACSRAPTATRPPLSPRAAIARLIEAHQASDHERLRALIVPGRVTDVVNTLMAVSEFLNANRRLVEVVRQDVGLGLADTIDQSWRAYYLDVFSKYVELLDESITGDSATVSFMVDGQLPARQTQLRLIEGTWRYDPGLGDYARLAEAYQRMARGLRLVTEDISGGRLSIQDLRDNPDRLVEEVRVRLLPGVQMLPQPPTTSAAGEK